MHTPRNMGGIRQSPFDCRSLCSTPQSRLLEQAVYCLRRKKCTSLLHENRTLRSHGLKMSRICDGRRGSCLLRQETQQPPRDKSVPGFTRGMEGHATYIAQDATEVIEEYKRLRGQTRSCKRHPCHNAKVRQDVAAFAAWVMAGRRSG